ncbi:MAG: hypothetical protein AAGF73_08860 [Actinomycetota bacterium]
MSPIPTYPFRFGVQLTRAPTGGSWAEQARQLENRGYVLATMPDHFSDQCAPMPALQAVLNARERYGLSDTIISREVAEAFAPALTHK